MLRYDCKELLFIVIIFGRALIITFLKVKQEPKGSFLLSGVFRLKAKAENQKKVCDASGWCTVD